MNVQIKKIAIVSLFAASLGFAAEPKDRYDRAGESTKKAVEKVGDAAEKGIDATGKGVGAVVEHGGRGTEIAAKNTGRAAKKAGSAIKNFFTEDAGARKNEDRVRAVQTKLKEDGLYDGPIDGVAGPQTRTAVSSYQTQKGMESTGRVDSATAKSLGVD